jgi:L-rhamnose mutarotase
MRYFFRLSINPEDKELYISRHKDIWPEMVAELKMAGIRNYSLFLKDNEVYGYWECDDLETTINFLNNSKINKKWQESMKGIITDRDDTIPSLYSEVFHMD